jgi:hypothetical protein
MIVTTMAVVAWLSEVARQFFASTLASTLIASAFGAFAGAFTANRVQTKRAVVAELNSINSALLLCFSICNRAISLKKQIVRPTFERYQQLKKAFEAARASPSSAAGAAIFTFLADLQTITPPIMPNALLERQLFEKISVRGRALAAAVDLAGAIDALDKTIQYRNDLIDEIKKASLPQQQLIELYFGLKTASGATDQRFPAYVTAISQQTDDCIFFSRIAASDLFEYGTKLRKRHARRLMLGLPKPTRADWITAEQAGLIPPDTQYADWLKGFQKTPSRRERLAAWRRKFTAAIAERSP